MINNIKVYSGKHVRNDFHMLIETIGLYLEKKYNAILVDITDNTTVNINGIIGKVLDCEMLIHIIDDDILYGISFCDTHSPMIQIFSNRNNILDKLLYSQYTNSALIVDDSYKFQIIHSIYTPCYSHINLDAYYLKRISRNKYKKNLYFRGNIVGANRLSIPILQNYKEFYGGDGINELNYFNELTEHGIGLSIPGIGELCFRDIEYMAVGIPMLKFEYLTQLNPPLIPNYHYISINRINIDNIRPIDIEREGGQEYVDLYINRFEEVINNTEFLDFISQNARTYYINYLHPLSRIKHILKLLNIEYNL